MSVATDTKEEEGTVAVLLEQLRVEVDLIIFSEAEIELELV